MPKKPLNKNLIGLLVSGLLGYVLHPISNTVTMLILSLAGLS